MLTPHKKTPPAPDIILFDLDGTLWRLPRLFTALAGAWDRVQPTLRRIFGMTQTPSLAITPASPISVKPGIFVNFLYRILRPRTMPHAPELLSYLDKTDIIAGIVSNGPRRWGDFLLRKFSLSSHFAAASFRHNGIKPSPQPLLNTVEQATITQDAARRTVWLVGDRASDIHAALNAEKIQNDYLFVPVAIGANTKAVRTLKKLQQRGQAHNGLHFENYASMLAYLKPHTS